MSTRVRKQIYIEPEQEAVLKRISNERGISEAEIIRQAITQHVSNTPELPHNMRAWAAEREFIVRLMQQGVESGERTWKREDLHDR